MEDGEPLNEEKNMAAVAIREGEEEVNKQIYRKFDTMVYDRRKHEH